MDYFRGVASDDNDTQSKVTSREKRAILLNVGELQVELRVDTVVEKRMRKTKNSG